MADVFHFLEEPELIFGSGQTAADPRDGLALFGPAETRASLPGHVALGTMRGLELWNSWVQALNSPAACIELGRQRPWPPYPTFEVAFGAPWPKPMRTYQLDAAQLDRDARRADRHERAFEVTNQYLSHVAQIGRLDEKPALVVCVVPDEVHRNCRMQSSVPDPSDERRTLEARRRLNALLKDHAQGQVQLFEEDDTFGLDTGSLEKYGLSPDFRRQLKARLMAHELPVQIVRESTLEITEQVRKGIKGTNPLSDRLWNFGTGIYYKCGRKPWLVRSTRESVCYIGLAYRRTKSTGGTACCATQMFLDSGDGLVFVGEFGPWYSEERNEFHLTKDAAQRLLSGTLETYYKQGGQPLREIFLHARSGIDEEEYKGFLKACPEGSSLVGIRVRKDRYGARLFRHDDHPEPAKRGRHPVLRGVFWQRTSRHGLLFTSGFKPRIGTYDGWEIPVPLSITIQHGKGNLVSIAYDILGLTKVNYNTCQLGESEPITVKYSDRIGEILLANPELSEKDWQHNFKYYI